MVPADPADPADFLYLKSAGSAGSAGTVFFNKYSQRRAANLIETIGTLNPEIILFSRLPGTTITGSGCRKSKTGSPRTMPGGSRGNRSGLPSGRRVFRSTETNLPVKPAG